MYTVNLTKEQLEVILVAVEMYSRIGQMQYGAALTLHPDVQSNIINSKHNLATFPDFMDKVNDCKAIFYMPPNHNHGITSPNIHDTNRIAFDIQQCIQHRLSWDKMGNPSKRDWATMGSYVYDEPDNFSSQPLPIITLQNENENE